MMLCHYGLSRPSTRRIYKLSLCIVVALVKFRAVDVLVSMNHDISKLAILVSSNHDIRVRFNLHGP